MSNTTNYGQSAEDNNINTAKAALEANGFKVTVVEDLKQAKDAVLKLVPEGSQVFTSTSVTLDQSGITESLNDASKYKPVRDKFMELMGQPDKAIEMRQIGSAMEYVVGSVHALTEDGQVLVASATGSQIPSYSYGASHVIWVVGSQKIVKDLAQAFDRLEKHTFPLENERAKKAYGVNSSINKLLIYKKEPAGRVQIVIVKEAVGF